MDVGKILYLLRSVLRWPYQVARRTTGKNRRRQLKGKSKAGNKMCIAAYRRHTKESVEQYRNEKARGFAYNRTV